MKGLLLSKTLAILAFLAVGQAAAATLQVSGTELIGALNVDVEGTLYDVQFVDGTCAALFSGCDDGGDFAFHTPTDALAAGQALFAQVFLDGPQGNFDSNPALTSGCEGEPFECEAFIPFSDGPVFYFADAENFTQDFSEGTGCCAVIFDVDTSSFPVIVWARWSLSANNSVPEPATLALLTVGLAGLGFSRRKRAHACGSFDHLGARFDNCPRKYLDRSR